MNKKIIGNAPENVKSEIIEFLKTFQEGYTKRDISVIDSFMEKLFDKEQDIVAVGTSNGEWILNFDEAKDLVQSDWQWWGDFSINIDDVIISYSDDIVWITTSGTVKYSYDNTEETYSRWLTTMEDYFKEDRNYDKSSMKTDLLHINWMLNHKLHDWGKEKREYLSPIRFTAVVTKSQGRFVFKQMQFSLPAPSYPDVRIDKKNMKIEILEDTKKKLREFKQNRTVESADEIRRVLEGFQKDYLDSSNIRLNELTQKYFAPGDYAHFIDTKNYMAMGLEEIKKLILSHQEKWDTISIDIDEAIIGQHENTAWVLTGGYLKKTMNEEEALKRQIDNIKRIYYKEASPKEKLFEIRENISLALKEIEKGNEYIWPFRLEGVLLKHNGSWKFDYMQFSFPFYYILEGLRDEVLLD